MDGRRWIGGRFIGRKTSRSGGGGGGGVGGGGAGRPRRGEEDGGRRRRATEEWWRRRRRETEPWRNGGGGGGAGASEEDFASELEIGGRGTGGRRSGRRVVVPDEESIGGPSAGWKEWKRTTLGHRGRRNRAEERDVQSFFSCFLSRVKKTKSKTNTGSWDIENKLIQA